MKEAAEFQSAADVTVTTSFTDLMTRVVRGDGPGSAIEIENTGAVATSDFKVQGQSHKAGQWYDLPSAHWSELSGDPAALAAAGFAQIRVDAGNLYAYRLMAKVASKTTTVATRGVVSFAPPIRNAADIASIKTAIELLDDVVVAHDASAASAKGLMVGAEARSSERAAVAQVDLARLVATLTGKLITMPFANPENSVQGTTGASPMTDDTEHIVTGIGQPGAALRNYITGVIVTNMHATVGTRVDLLDGTGGAILTSIGAVALGGGASWAPPSPIQMSLNKALYAKNAVTGADVTVSAVGFTGV